MSIHTDFPLPWHITYTARHRARGYNSHIRAADDSYVAERITNEDLALYIVEVVNDRYELRDELAAANARAEAAEAVREVYRVLLVAGMRETRKLSAAPDKALYATAYYAMLFELARASGDLDTCDPAAIEAVAKCAGVPIVYENEVQP